MAAEVVSAGTFVGAVLEHHGYLTQAAFLESFKSFFRDAGALLYLIAGVGGVLSVAMYGSFRAARYLLLGPALYWFLVIPTTTTGGVIWKLGDGQPLGELRTKGEGASTSFRDKVLKKMNVDESRREIKVATGFWLFAWPISEFVNEFVGRMLNDEDTHDLTANHKVGALEAITAILPTYERHVLRMDQFAAQCGRTISSANAAAAILSRKKKGELSESEQKALDTHLEKLREFSTKEFVDTEHSGFDHLIESHHKKNGTSELAKQLFDEGANKALRSISCADAWALVAEETWHESGEKIPDILRLGTGAWDYFDAKEAVCLDLTRKTFKEEDTECNLRPAIGISMLNNHFSAMTTWGRVLAIHWNQRDALNPKQDRLISGPMTKGYRPVLNQDGQFATVMAPNNGNPTFSVVFERVGPDKSKPDYQHVPMTTLMGIHGMDHAMWVSTRRHAISELRQEIYSFAMQLPYFQGMCLYFLAIAYPFVALIVILPGKAPNFMNLPLMWLWVKSWDIGFAALIILDKVMYNNLPDWQVPEELHDGNWSPIERLPELLATGYNYDPLEALHIYYTVLAMVGLAIPAITGAATIRARRGILGSFTGSAAAQAKSHASAAGNAYSIKAQNQRSALLRQIQGWSKLSTIQGAGGPMSGLRGASAEFYGGLAAGLHAFNNTDLAKIATQDPMQVRNLPAELMSARELWISKRKEIAIAEAKYESTLTAEMHPVIGRWGPLQMAAEAYSSAMSGPGGFELDITRGTGDAYVGLFAKKMGILLEHKSSFLENAATRGADDAIAAVLSGNFLNKTGSLDTVGKIIAMSSARKAGLANTENLKSALGAEAYTDEEFLSRVLHTNPGSGRPLFDAVYGLKTHGIAPGGTSSLLDQQLRGSGPSRFTAPPALQGTTTHPGNSNFTLSSPSLQNKSFWESVDESARNLHGLFSAVTSSHYELLNQRREADSQFAGEGWYQAESERLKNSLVTRFGASFPGFHEDIKPIIDRRLQNDPGGDSSITPVDLAVYASQIAQAETSQRWHSTIEQMEKGEIEPYRGRHWLAEIQYGELPAGLAMLAKSNSLMAEQLIEEWLERRNGRSVFSSNLHPTDGADNMLFDSSGFYRRD